MKPSSSPQMRQNAPRTAVRALVVAWAAVLAGCTTVGPDHTAPTVDKGPDWIQPSAATPGASAVPLDRWWTLFDDATLNQLVEAALERNLDLRQALATVEASRVLITRAEASASPSLTARGGIQQQRISLNAPEFNAQRSADQTVGDVGFEASWEVDLFGSVRRQTESAQARLEVAQAEAKALRMTVAAEVARNYFLLRGTQQELGNRQEAKAALLKLLAIAQQRRAAGEVAAAEVDRVLLRLAQADAAIAPLESRRRAAALALGLLTAGLPEAHIALEAGPGVLPALKPIPLGQRADILRRRPDVIAAERRLAAATADVGVATAELFPKLTLSASAGLRALSPASLVDGDSTRASVQPLLSWRVLDGGRVKAEIRAADVQRQRAAAAYEMAVLTALNDAERALAQYTSGLQADKALLEAWEAAVREEQVTQRRYAAGDLSRAEWLETVRDSADLSAALAQSGTGSAVSLVALFKALGGGWVPPEPTSPPAAGAL